MVPRLITLLDTKGLCGMDNLAPIRTAIRALICTECHRRLATSDASRNGARPCEEGCEVFSQLPRLAALARRFGQMPPCGYAIAVQNLICQRSGQCDCKSCQCDQTPLVRYANEVFAVLTSTK